MAKGRSLIKWKNAGKKATVKMSEEEQDAWDRITGEDWEEAQEREDDERREATQDFEDIEEIEGIPIVPKEAAAAAATKGAGIGTMAKKVGRGLVPGAAALWLTQQAYGAAQAISKQGPIGVPETAGVTARTSFAVPGDGGEGDLKELLDVQKQVANVGLPIKGVVKTIAAGSKL